MLLRYIFHEIDYNRTIRVCYNINSVIQLPDLWHWHYRWPPPCVSHPTWWHTWCCWPPAGPQEVDCSLNAQGTWPPIFWCLCTSWGRPASAGARGRSLCAGLEVWGGCQFSCPLSAASGQICDRVSLHCPLLTRLKVKHKRNCQSIEINKSRASLIIKANRSESVRVTDWTHCHYQLTDGAQLK